MPNEETIVLSVDERPAVAASDRANKALRGAESTAADVGKSIGNVFDQLARASIRTAEAVGAVAIAFGSIKGALALMRGGTAEIVAQGSAMDGLLNSFRGVRLALNPTYATAWTIAAGVAVEATIKLIIARKQLYDQEALQAARSGVDFTSAATVGILQRGFTPGSAAAFSGMTAIQIHNIAEEFEGIEDPVNRAARAVELFKDKAADALPLLNRDLKDNVDAAFELATAIDAHTRIALQNMAEDFHLLGQPIREVKNDLLGFIEAAKNTITVHVAVAYEGLRAEYTEGQGAAQLAARARLGAARGMGPGAPPSLLDIVSTMEGPSGAIAAALAGRGGFTGAITPPPFGGMFESQMTGTRAFGNSLPMQLEAVNSQLSSYTQRYTTLLSEGIVPPPDWDKAIAGLQARKKALEQSEAFVRSVDELIDQTRKSVPSLLFGKLYVTSPFEQKLSEQSGKFFAGAEKIFTQTTKPGIESNQPPEAFDLLNIQRMLVPFQLPQRHGPGFVSGDALAGLKGSAEDLKKNNDIQLEFLNHELEMQERLAKLTWGEDAQDGITKVYNLRIEYADKEFQINRQTMGDLLAGYKELEQIDKARVSAQEQIAALQDRQKESIAKPTEELLTTLFTHPQGFGRQLGGTVRDAALRPITSGLSKMLAQISAPLFFGASGQGGIAGAMDGLFSGGGDPIKISTDMNTSATAENSARLANLTAIIASAGGGGGGGGTAMIPGGPSFAMAGPAGPALGMLTSMAPMLTLGADTSGFAAGGGTGFAGLAPILGAPGGTAGFSRAAVGGGGGLLPSFGGGTASRGLFGGGFNLSALRQNFFNAGSIATGAGTATTAAGIGGWQGTAAGILTSPGAGALMTSVGFPLASAGIFGQNRGTAGGIFESTLGGALTGAGIGTMVMPGFGTLVGAAIGAGVGLGVSVGETLAGIEAPWKRAQELVQQRYGVSIDHATGQSIADLAKQKYGGNISVAVSSPDVRQMLQLYAAATGQRMALSASTPRAGSLTEQGGTLYQQATYQFGNPFAYQSNLPILGGGAEVGTYPSPGGSGNNYFSLHVSGNDVASFMTGSFVTPQFVADQGQSALAGSYGRLSQSAMIQAPGLITG